MYKTKTILLILVLLALLLVLLIVRINLAGKNPPRGLPVPTSTALPEDIPSSTELFSPTPQSSTTFSVIDHSLPTSSTIAITDSFQVYFSKPPSSKDFSFSINPKVPVEFSLDNTGTILEVKPKNTWSFGESYTFTIKKETRSMDGNSLNADVNINFKVAPYSGI